MKKISVRADKNIISHIVIGALLSLASLFILSVILAILVEKETISITATPAIARAIHTVCVLAGSLLSIILEKGRTAIVAAIVTGVYLVALVCMNMLIFSSGITGIGSTAASAAIGAFVAVVIHGYISREKRHRVKLRSR